MGFIIQDELLVFRKCILSKTSREMLSYTVVFLPEIFLSLLNPFQSTFLPTIPLKDFLSNIINNLYIVHSNSQILDVTLCDLLRGTQKPSIIYMMFNFLKIIRNKCNIMLRFDKTGWLVHQYFTYSLFLSMHLKYFILFFKKGETD